MSKLAIKLIKFYQKFISSLIKNNAVPLIIGSSCKFHPSCSEYAIESINQYGIKKGLKKSIGRLFRCNPWTSPGIDIP